MQAFTNTVGANSVKSEGVTPVDSSSVPLGTATNPFSVAVADTITTGTLDMTNASADIQVVLQAHKGVGFIITGSWTGTITFYGSVDGSGWVVSPCLNPNTLSAATSTTFNATFLSLLLGGYQKFRLAVSATGTGTASIQFTVTDGLTNWIAAVGTVGQPSPNQVMLVASERSGSPRKLVSATADPATSTEAIAVRPITQNFTNMKITSKISSPDGTVNIGDATNPVRVDPTGTTAQPVSNVQQWIGSTAPTVGQKTMANSLPVAISSDQSSLDISDREGRLLGRENGTVSAGDSSTTLLGIGGIFTGAYENVKDYGAITISIFADQASAANGLEFDWSHDGVNTDSSSTTNISASAGRAFNISP